MRAELHDAGLYRTADGSVIKLRLPCRPRAPRYLCSGCGQQVTGNVDADEPAIYEIQCLGCGLVTRVVCQLSFFVVTS